MSETNWAGNIHYSTQDVATPASVEELQELVARASHLRPLGTRHSFNTLADADGALLAMTGLPERFELGDGIVTVNGGVRYGELARRLEAEGRALANLASLPHISVAGAIATGTHGSGDRNGSLATSVVGLEFVDGSGELVTIAQGDPDFDGHVVSLGALGAVTAVTLKTEPTFEVSQSVFTGLSWDSLLADYDAVTSAGYSVSIFTRWIGESAGQVWVKSRVDAGVPTTIAGGTPATVTMPPLEGSTTDSITEQLGVPGPWFERLPHFRLDFTPSNGSEIQSEFLVPRQHAVAALAALRELGPRFDEILYVSELRSFARDNLWLSGAYETDVVGIHLTWKLMDAEVRAMLPVVEAALAPFDARPHWGKLFIDESHRVPSLYPRMADFRALAERRDPRGVFHNEFLSRYVFGDAGTVEP